MKKITGVGEGLRHCGMPLGGLGTGSVELGADGYLRDWQIMNNAPWGAGPELRMTSAAERAVCYFALQVHGAGTPQSAILGTVPEYGPHLNNPYHLPWVQHARATNPRARFPFMELKYDFERLPLEISLEAFGPFIPHDAANSGLPLAFFSFTLRNRTRRKLHVALVSALRNLVGYDSDATSVIRFDEKGPALLFAADGLRRDGSSNGSMALAAQGRGWRATWAAHLRSTRDIWDALRAQGRLENRDFGSYTGPLGDHGAEERRGLRNGMPYGALCVERSLAADATAKVTFALAWHFPNQWESVYEPKCCGGRLIGHQYANRFRSAQHVCRYGLKNAGVLREESLAFVEGLYRGSLPGWLADAMNAQLSTFVKSTWWDRRGRFGIWEGLGCCGLQTTDVSHYASWAVLSLFPDLEHAQVNLTAANVENRGHIGHSMPRAFSCCNMDEMKRTDLAPDFVLAAWRDWRWTGDKRQASRLWPLIESALEFHRRYDTDGDGLPNNSGPDQTYDQFPLHGTSSLVGFLFAASLLAASELAAGLGRRARSEELRRRFDAAMGALDAQLWNGSCYRLSHDPATGKNNEGIMLDQINADWFVRQATGRPLVPDVHERKSLRTILRACRSPDGFLLNCAWPRGEAAHIPRHTSDQANCPWSGVEYAFAAHLALAGMEREGIHVARDVWERYERAGLRLNHIECGEHYHRPLSVWALLLALSGLTIDRPRGMVTLRIGRRRRTLLVSAPTGWGQAEFLPPGAMLRLNWQRGELSFRTLRLTAAGKGSLTLKLNGRRVPHRMQQESDGVSLQVIRLIRLRRDDLLEVRRCGKSVPSFGD